MTPWYPSLKLTEYNTLYGGSEYGISSYSRFPMSLRQWTVAELPGIV